jgi:flagellar basal-body rod modification protein FlgD
MIDASTLSLGGLATGGKLTAGTDGAKINQSFDEFLMLLTTQMRNQDPLDPMDSKEFTNQLVAFSQVEQQISLNSKLEDMVKLQQASTVNAALGYIGLNVNYTGNKITNFADGKPINTSYTLAADAKTTDISVVNAAGTVVWKGPGAITAGSHQFTWNGTNSSDGAPAPAGIYEVRIGAQNAQGAGVATSLVVPGLVDGVETADGQVYLTIGDQKITLDTVKSAKII